ncbi:hypothetical protein [Enterobacter mori]|uniref:hypothetical protein n=1 Tax=Enterobacter mori TaxID=539813 RepID=UPI0022367DCF|nr:hypothetical protein [Enterobacter mori]MCW4986263.1 hypothetical protein [Enterobacter mori]
MWQDILSASWANKWAAISAISTALTVIVAGFALFRWRKQDELKAKMAFKMAVAEYANILDQMPDFVKTFSARVQNEENIANLGFKFYALQNALLVCEDILKNHGGVEHASRKILQNHHRYLNGATSKVEARYACKLILKERFVFKTWRIPFKR